LILSRYLQEILEFNLIFNLLNQSITVATSLGSIGLDCRGLMIEIFERIILFHFSSDLESIQEVIPTAIVEHGLFVPYGNLVKFGLQIPESYDSWTQEDLKMIMEYPPLFQLVSKTISILNNLSLCPLFSCRNKMFSLFDNCLALIHQTILHLDLKDGNPKTETEEREEYKEGRTSVMIVLFHRLVVPFFLCRLEIIFQSPEISMILCPKAMELRKKHVPQLKLSTDAPPMIENPFAATALKEEKVLEISLDE